LAGKHHGAVDRPELTPSLLLHLENKAASLEPALPAIEDWTNYVLVLPKHGNARHLVFLLVGKNGMPAVVVKLSRIPGDDAGIVREAQNLRLLAPRLTTGQARAPRVLLLDRWHNRRLLVEQALNGEALEPGKHSQRDVDDVLGWLQVAAKPSGSRRMVGTRYESLVARPLRLAARVLAAAGADAGRLHSVAERTLSSLRGSQLPVVFEHGHLGFRNIIRLDEGGIGVIDWEYGRPDGVPLSDIVFFLSCVAEAKGRYESTAQASIEELMSPRSWGRDTLEAFARGLKVPPRLVSPLIVLSFTRQLATLSMQLLPGLGDPSADVSYKVAASVAHHRYRWLWESALTAAALEQ
jgi:hypothetical protein